MANEICSEINVSGQRKEKEIEITIQKSKTGDPAIFIWRVELRHGNGIWPETYGSKELLEAYLRGVKASLFFTDYQAQIPPTP